jgi:zinc transport system ATP-binding protein
MLPLIEARALDVEYGPTSVISGIDLAVEEGRIVTVIGPNGAGKTTLLRALLGLVKPTRGQVIRRTGLSIGYMPQRLMIDQTLPITVGRFLRLAGNGQKPDLEAALEMVGAPGLINAPLHHISGGQVQRVLLARAMLRRPDLLVLDEPAQGVDLTGQTDLYQLIANIRDRHGCGVLMVSHDLHLVMAQADEVVCINHHLCCAGHPEAISRDPSYVELFGAREAQSLAPYHHHHDHAHDADGSVMPVAPDPPDLETRPDV